MFHTFAFLFKFKAVMSEQCLDKHSSDIITRPLSRQKAKFETKGEFRAEMGKES